MPSKYCLVMAVHAHGQSRNHICVWGGYVETGNNKVRNSATNESSRTAAMLKTLEHSFYVTLIEFVPESDPDHT
jgi:hypothetical protein